MRLGVDDGIERRFAADPFADQVERHIQHPGKQREHQLQVEEAAVGWRLMFGVFHCSLS